MCFGWPAGHAFFIAIFNAFLRHNLTFCAEWLIFTVIGSTIIITIRIV